MDLEQACSGGNGLISFRNHLSNLGLLLRGELGAASPDAAFLTGGIDSGLSAFPKHGALAASRLQRRHLSHRVLIVRGNAGVTAQHCIKVSLITLILQYRFATPKLLKTRSASDRCKTVRLCKLSYNDPSFPSPRMIPDRSSPSRVRFAASRPGRLRADPKDALFTREKGGSGRVAQGRVAKRMINGYTSCLSRSRGVLSSAGP